MFMALVFCCFVMHVFSSLFIRHRFSPYERLLSVLSIKVNEYRCYLWATIDVDSGEVLTIYVFRGRSMPNALIFLKIVLKPCERTCDSC